MKSGYYWVRNKFSGLEQVVYWDECQHYAFMIGCSLPLVKEHFEVLSKVERTTSVTVEQTESEFEHVQPFCDGAPVVRQRAEFPVHRVTIEHDGVMTEVTGIVTASRSKGTLKRFGFTTARGADGTVTLYRDPSRDQLITKQEETNGQEEVSRH